MIIVGQGRAFNIFLVPRETDASYFGPACLVLPKAYLTQIIKIDVKVGYSILPCWPDWLGSLAAWILLEKWSTVSPMTSPLSLIHI